jgi:HEAT repeat protein
MRVIDEDRALPYLRAYVADNRKNVRMKALGQLSLMGTKARGALRDVVRGFRESDPLLEEYRVEAARELVGGDEAGYALICGLADDEDSAVRLGALEAMARLTLPREITRAVAEKHMKDPDPGIRAAASALMRGR